LQNIDLEVELSKLLLYPTAKVWGGWENHDPKVKLSLSLLYSLVIAVLEGLIFKRLHLKIQTLRFLLVDQDFGIVSKLLQWDKLTDWRLVTLSSTDGTVSKWLQ
jgi:hypothetical protein